MAAAIAYLPSIWSLHRASIPVKMYMSKLQKLHDIVKLFFAHKHFYKVFDIILHLITKTSISPKNTVLRTNHYLMLLTVKHRMLIFGYRWSNNTPGCADKLNNARGKLTIQWLYLFYCFCFCIKFICIVALNTKINIIHRTAKKHAS